MGRTSHDNDFAILDDASIDAVSGGSGGFNIPEPGYTLPTDPIIVICFPRPTLPVEPPTSM